MTLAPTSPPPYRLLGHMQTESDEWRTVRQNRIGGSEIAAVLGLSPYESRFSLWMRKRGYAGPADPNNEMRWGQKLEAVLMATFFEQHPELAPLGRGVFVNADRPWQLASPDERAVVVSTGENILVETKTSPFGEGWGNGPGDVPIYVKCQVQWYLDTFDYERAYVPLLVSGCDYREYVIERNRDDGALLREAAQEFIWTIENDQMPDIDGHDETYRVLQEMHPLIDGTTIEVGDELGEGYIRARLAETDAAWQHTQMKSRLLAEAGPAKIIKWRGTKIADRRAKSAESTPYLQANGDKALRAALVTYTTIREAAAAAAARNLPPTEGASA